MSDVVRLTKQLVNLESVSPNDAGCQNLIASKLSAFGFDIVHLPFGDVDNLWATIGSGSPVVVLAGHTDVVPTGEKSNWHTPPFTAVEKDGYLYGRGTADMKGGLAAMIVACKHFLAKHSTFKGTLAFLITSDEEDAAINGTKKVINHLISANEKIDYCIIGEPSSQQQLGDQIRIGRRGSLHGNLTIIGKQGHVAYPKKALNPIHLSMAALHELVHTIWDNGNNYFPATSLQITNYHAGTGLTNVIPNRCQLSFNFRYSPESTQKSLQERVEDILAKHKLNYELAWQLSGKPFYTKPGKLIQAITKSIYDTCNIQTKLSTDGGTSDGRFIAETGAEIVELGLCNATIHQANECIKIENLEKLVLLYENILSQLLGQ